MKIVNCNNCGSNQQTFLLKGKDRLYKVDQKQFTYVKCVECGLVFLNPQPEIEELKNYYPEEYGPYQDSNTVFKYGLFSNLFKKIKDYKNTSNKISGNDSSLNYLDFGCGGGESLMSVKENHPKWKLYGMDNNEYACKKIEEKGFNAFCGDILEMDIPINFFDIVNMSHVIEHLSEPKATLLKINTTMKKGSKIIISTPNFDSLASKFFRTYWYALEAPRHLFLFTPTTLKRLLEDTGFVVESVEFDMGPKTGIRSLYYLLGKKDLRINPFIWRLFKPMSYILGKLGKTSIMTVYARKT